jgi:uncharacterized protein
MSRLARRRNSPLDDPILVAVRERLRTTYGGRIKRMVLYGSRARGDHKRNSDYDIAVFLRDYDGSWGEKSRMADIGYELMMERKKDVSVKPFRLVDWRIDTLFMRHLRRDGIEL